MQHIISVRRVAALTLTAGAVCAIGGQAAVAAPATAITRTFSFIGKPNSKTVTVINNVDSLIINARCTSNGSPLVFAFTKAPVSDIFARVFDGSGRVHVSKNTSFGTKSSIQLSPSNFDFDSTGSVLFETLSSQVVTVNIAFDNSTTLGKRRLCTVFGSYIAT